MSEVVNVGVIGAGLMGRETASALGRWFALDDYPIGAQLRAVCDTDPDRLAWFSGVPGVELMTDDYQELLASDLVDVVYIAVPHNLHEQMYVDAAEAGKDLLAEKPFGIDLAAAERIRQAVAKAGVFVRCSSEMPFFPGAQAAITDVAEGRLGQILEAECSFLHSSDLDVNKPINWKRQQKFCGPTGVMADLGMHVLHAPLRLGWEPTAVYGVLQDVVRERPDPAGGAPIPCDTIDNATLLCRSGDPGFPLRLETKRIAPGEMNTWRFRAVGMDGGVEFSTRHPQIVRRSSRDGKQQVWTEVQPGSQSAFKTITGGIFEFGFADAIQQMWAAFLAERSGALGNRFGCATPDEALTAHRVFDAALKGSEAECSDHNL